jgi:hypothetical protein
LPARTLRQRRADADIGPCRISDESGPTPWKYGWNEHANVFFVDQPVGVGFSYADHGEHVSTTEEAALDAAALSFVFFEHFRELKGNAFHMAGESYGGRYIPLFAAAVHDLNPRLVRAGFDAVNLSSVMIGQCARRRVFVLCGLSSRGTRQATGSRTWRQWRRPTSTCNARPQASRPSKTSRARPSYSPLADSVLTRAQDLRAHEDRGAALRKGVQGGVRRHVRRDGLRRGVLVLRGRAPGAVLPDRYVRPSGCPAARG